ncbi:MAG: DNA repair exonuclease [Methanobacterium paludis]|nr:DNA repair exonuclease [Methanobacterium paludis]
MIRFIHTADLHLDRPFEGLSDLPETIHRRIKNSIFCALDRLIHYSIDEKVDFVLIAGDLFDDGQKSIRAQKRVIEAMNRLKEASIPVYLVFGNHDPLDNPWNRLDFPDNVHVFSDKPGSFLLNTSDGEHVALYGFSYPHRHIPEDMAARYEKNREADYHIGILHGSFRSSAKTDVYAPFTLEELKSKGMDYWALGHIHARSCLSSAPPIWYSGDIQGLSVKETGEKGVSLVSLDHQEADVRLLPTADILWDSYTLDFPKEAEINDWDRQFQKVKDRFRREREGVFLRLDLTFADRGADWTENWEDELADLLAAANESEAERTDFVWLIAGSIRIKPAWSRQQILESPHFVGEVFRLIESQKSVGSILAPLYSHRQGRRYLQVPEGTEAQQIQRAAEQILADALLSDPDRK